MYTLKHFSGIHGEKERLEGISPCVYDPVSILMHTKVRVAQLCPTLWDGMNYVHGLLQARIPSLIQGLLGSLFQDP